MKSTTIEVSEEIKQRLIKFVKQNGFITNRQCRVLLGIGFEQAITLFNKLVESGELIREGRTSSVKYRLSVQKKVTEPQQGGFEQRPYSRGRRSKRG